MTFHIGEKVVYPNQGVATIESISVRYFGSQLERFYLLRLIYSSMTVMLPVSQAQEVGLRRVTRNGEIARMLSFLAAETCPCTRDWKNRFRENSERMRAGGLLQIAEVLKSLLRQEQTKPLSFREKKMLDRARRMLVSELSISRGLDEAEAACMLEQALSKARLRLPRPL